MIHWEVHLTETGELARDFIGHAELPESKIDGKVARHLDRGCQDLHGDAPP